MIDLSAFAASFGTVRIFIVVAIAVVYALFDLFNSRNIPNSVAYASVAVGIASLVFLKFQLVVFDLLVALVVAALSYVLYRIGQLGAGDGYEFVSIALLLPLQPAAYMVGIPQFSLPFILSVFVATGFVAIIWVPIYYLLFKKGKMHNLKVKKRGIGNAMIILASYGALEVLLTYGFGFRISSLVIITLLAVPSAITVYYREEISVKMASEIYPRGLQDGDFIAVNLMSNEDLRYFTSKYKGFGRLATQRLIHMMKNERKKVPVYSDAVPLAAATLAGVVISLLFGNILLGII